MSKFGKDLIESLTQAGAHALGANDGEVRVTTAVDAEIQRLISLATAFREAIERCDRSKLPISFEGFPAGCCGDATPLLGAFLKNRGERSFNYMLGERVVDGKSSHAWLQSGDLIVDITADQFPEICERVVVTENSVWHATLNGAVQNEAHFQVYDLDTAATLGGAYGVILCELEDIPIMSETRQA